MKVFLHDDIHPAAVQFLKDHGEIIDDWDRIGEADGIVVRKIKLDRAMIEKCVNCKAIGFHGAGLNGIDLEACRERGIDVFTTPGQNADSVAELNVALALDMAHMITTSAHEIKQGVSMKDGLLRFRGHEISHKKAGFIGTGQVGRRTIKILQQSFHMDVIAYSIELDDKLAAELGVQRADSPEEVFREAEFIFLSVPLTPETEYLINEKTLSMMREDAILINTARGKLVKEEDLYKALKEHRIRAAASDVSEKEPLEPGNPLVTLDNFVITPHIGGNTHEALYRVGMSVVEGIYERVQA